MADSGMQFTNTDFTNSINAESILPLLTESRQVDPLHNPYSKLDSVRAFFEENQDSLPANLVFVEPEKEPIRSKWVRKQLLKKKPNPAVFQ